jgi:hypothetical protein
VRVLFVAALVMLLAWLLATAWREAPPTPPAQPPAPAVTHQKLKDCRDLCEQNAIVEQLPEELMRACRLRCEGRFPPPRREPIRRITVAPADHSRTIRSEPPAR